MNSRLAFQQRCRSLAALATGLLLTLSRLSGAEDSAKARYPQVSEAACPVNVVSVPGKAGNEVSAVVRQPPGNGPFPAIVLLHGGLSPYRLETLKQESLTRPNYTRFLAAGFVIIVPTFRSREENPQTRDALDDCLAVVDYVKKMPAVDPESVAVLGGSGGGSLALELAGDGRLSVIGGAEIFGLFLPLATKIELTEVLADYDGETAMPDPRESGAWLEISREEHEAENGRPPFRFITLKRAPI